MRHLAFSVLATVTLAGCNATARHAPASPPSAPHTAAVAVDPKAAALAKEMFLELQNDKIDRSKLSASARAVSSRPDIVRETKSISSNLKKFGTLQTFTFASAQRLRDLTEYTFIATVGTKKFAWQVALDKSNKVAGMLIFPYTTPAAHLSQSALLAALGRRLQADAKSGRFAGAVLVAKDGKPIFAQAYGQANRARNIPNTLDTRFRIGSMNKMFTAVAVMQLVQRGKIGLDESFGKYLSDYPNKAFASEVTIRELLTHMGGTGDIFGPPFVAHRLTLRTLQDYEKLYGSRGPAFKPGSRWDYSNYGYILLGLVIEKVSGQSYYDYIREHVYAPAGMVSSGSRPENETIANRSVGYTKVNGKQWESNANTLPYRATSAGGGYTTAGDLLRFANALTANNLLDANGTKTLTTGKVAMPSVPFNPRKYAFGFVDQTINGVRCFGHDGGAPGMNGDLEICPVPGYIVIVLANLDPPAADDVSQFITNRLPAH